MSDLNIPLAYQETLDYLYSFVDYSLTRNLRYSPDKFDLSRMRLLLNLLDNPQDRYPVIHVAGTKGKGSISAMCAAGLESAGYKTGFYTSPHLEDYCERIQVNRVSIPQELLVKFTEEIKPFIQQVERITTFEITTALAFLYFARQNVDVAVVEVGLGGRLDATNVVNPLVSVISSLSFDHMNVLGNTLSSIATEKAGIIKPGRPVVLAPQKEEARLVVEKIARERNSKLIEVGKDIFYAAIDHSLEKQSLRVWFNPQSENLSVFKEIQSGIYLFEEGFTFNIPLLGMHQVENAATAFTTLKMASVEKLSLNDFLISEGFSKVVWSGRFEILQKNPAIVVDSAHNRDSAFRLRQAIDDYFPGKQVILIFGASEDKDISGMIEELLPRVRQVIMTQTVHPRAADPEKLIEMAKQFGKPARAIVPIEHAFSTAIQEIGENTILVAAGSLFIAAAIRNIWKERLKAALSESPRVRI